MAETREEKLEAINQRAVIDHHCGHTRYQCSWNRAEKFNDGGIFKKIRGMTDYSDQFRKIIMRYKRIGYKLNVMRQSACLVILVINPITVDGYAALFNCTPVDRASDSMMVPT